MLVLPLLQGTINLSVAEKMEMTSNKYLLVIPKALLVRCWSSSNISNLMDVQIADI